ncbi:hypothetical protein Tco_0332263 [Tanacetum coccineum]
MATPIWSCAPFVSNIKDEMERTLTMEAYFSPFQNIIVFKKLIHFLGTLSVQLKHTDWGFEGHEVYRKTKGDGLWHAKFEVITPSGRKFIRGFKTKETKRKLSRNFTQIGHSPNLEPLPRLGSSKQTTYWVMKNKAYSRAKNELSEFLRFWQIEFEALVMVKTCLENIRSAFKALG